MKSQRSSCVGMLFNKDYVPKISDEEIQQIGVEYLDKCSSKIMHHHHEQAKFLKNYRCEAAIHADYYRLSFLINAYEKIHNNESTLAAMIRVKLEKCLGTTFQTSFMVNSVRGNRKAQYSPALIARRMRDALDYRFNQSLHQIQTKRSSRSHDIHR